MDDENNSMSIRLKDFAVVNSEEKLVNVGDLTKKFLSFDDGIRQIDYILAWSEDNENQEAREARRVFENNLTKEGLQLEHDIEDSRNVNFVKIHAPWPVLTRYAEFLKIHMPIKEPEEVVYIHHKDSLVYPLQRLMSIHPTGIMACMSAIKAKLQRPFQLDNKIAPIKRREFSYPYSRDKEYMFNIPPDNRFFFSDSVRIQVVDFILRRKSFSDSHVENYNFGIRKMISDGYYCSAYPLHSGSWKSESPPNSRKFLYDHWASWRRILKIQPYNEIREYFGAKIGLYFSWLGLYTGMLVPASLIGIVCFAYGLLVMSTGISNHELCASSNITMCPLCDSKCPYWNLSAACYHVTASRLVDNRLSVLFAIFMSLWGTLFLEMWKRRQSVICWQWNLTNYVAEEEPPRPEYLSHFSNVSKVKKHPVTSVIEPHLPFWRHRVPVLCASFSTVILLVLLQIMAVIGVMIYRVSVFAAMNLQKRAILSDNARIFTSITAAVINLIVIMILNILYTKMAVFLTDYEFHRTQSHYDSSLTLKLFCMQFVNYYCSIIYIAFFKGRFIGYPGHYETLFGSRQEECGIGGCLIELTIQLAIIMIGKQLLQNNLFEIILPRIRKLLKRMSGVKYNKDDCELKSAWENDYNLITPAANMPLFYEYLEMVLQFGFLTLFATAFTLAPVVALLNNILEIRLDAMKFVCHRQRPRPDRVSNIGIWYDILHAVSRMAILFNAFIIAFTTDLIPLLVYQHAYSSDGSSSGYWQYMLSTFNVSDFGSVAPANPNNVTFCRYRDFRNPPDHPQPYIYSSLFWHVLAARFIFVVALENFVVILTSFVAWIIPDVPQKIRNLIRREMYVTNDLILKTELQRAQTPSDDNGLDKKNSSGPELYHDAMCGESMEITDKTRL